MASASSKRATSDAAKHLTERFTEVLTRHANIMEAGGMSTAEAAAAVMIATEQLAFTAIGLVVLQVEPGARVPMIDRTLGQLMINLMDRSDSMLREIGTVERAKHAPGVHL
ncbi:hypothetical protein GCM10022268_17020 [Sphingomonas cynarae]|uniref:Uncharacterized protein n=1 Tax=Sphingomonas cynarae TaxID=930197 RepID=A0ABP7DUQ0_9SPHN